MRVAIHPAAFLGGAITLSALLLWLRPPPPVEPPAAPHASARAAPVERHSIALDPAVLERYVGKYEGRGGFTVELELDKGRLIAQSPATGPMELFATAETEFFLKGIDVDVKFRFDKGGAVSGFVASTPGGVIYVERVR